jgi:neutral ceramidase
MKTTDKWIFTILVFLIAISPGLTIGQNRKTDKTLVKLGVSQVNVTPETPMLMSGYSARETPFTGIHDELFASALFFSSETTGVLVITADLIDFPSNFIDDLKKDISLKIDIPIENIMISALHNHNGPVINFPKSEEGKQYVKSLKEKLIALAVSASQNPEPFRMGIGKSSCNMNISRRAQFPDGSIGIGRNPNGICDHDLTGVKFENLNHEIMAVLINWPCHATVGGPENYLITGDWPGSAARFLKKQVGEDMVVAITAGASADINPIYGPGDMESNYGYDLFDEMDAIGLNLASNAWKTLVDTETFPVKTIQALYSTLTFPGKKRGTDNYPRAVYENNGPDVEIRITALKVGSLVLTGIFGELMTEIGMEVKNKSPYKNTIIITHCNGVSGYICTDKSYSVGGYEVKASRLLPGIEKPLISKFLELINAF